MRYPDGGEARIVSGAGAALLYKGRMMALVGSELDNGDRSYFQIDMASHLGMPYQISSDGEVQTDEVRDAELESLHWQMLTALQIFLLHACVPDRG